MKPYDLNPYGFVPIVHETKLERCSPYGHDKFNGKSGVITCMISTLNPIFIPLPMNDKERKKRVLTKPVRDNRGRTGEHKEYIFNSIEGVPVIPGSSLKGVIRSVAEAAANSCVSKFGGRYTYKHFGKWVDISYNLPNGFEECQYLEKLCITCRLFGFQSSAESFQGKVNISDAKAKKYKNCNKITLTELSTPKPHHDAFYARSSGTNIIAGRKFYFHHKQGANILSSRIPTRRNSTVNPIKDAEFKFNVSFTNLTDEEYALLLYSLFLEDNVCHKIGYGKPAGLGSVQIKPVKCTLFDIERYKTFTPDSKEEYEGAGLSTYIKEITKTYREDKSANLEALRRIWEWPGTHDIQYPDFNKSKYSYP